MSNLKKLIHFILFLRPSDHDPSTCLQLGSTASLVLTYIIPSVDPPIQLSAIQSHLHHLSAFPHLPTSPSYMLTFRHCYMFYCVTRTQPVTVEEKSERVNGGRKHHNSRNYFYAFFLQGLDCSGFGSHTYHATGTGYYPDDSPIEGGYVDMRGRPLRTLQVRFYRFLPSLDNWKKTDYRDWDGTTLGGCT